MTKEGLLAARAKIAELVGNDLRPDVNDTMRAIQHAFADWLGQQPDAANEVRQFFIRNTIAHLKKEAAEGELSDFERYRRQHPKSFHNYEAADGQQFPRGRGLRATTKRK